MNEIWKKYAKKAIKDKMEKWVWSRVLDIYEEEQLKGKTQEFNTVDFNYQDKKYQLIDTPGHKKFIRSMIEGISEDVNIAILLVSMIDNEFEASFERGMMKEHLILARAVGIEYLIVVANKMDVIDWDEKKCKSKIKTITKYLVKNLKLKRENLSVVPISAFDGTGLVDMNGMPDWYKGKSFLKTLDDIPDKKRDQPKNLVVETTRIICDVTILYTKKSVVSLGFIGIVHFNGKESEFVVEKIKGKKFLRSGDDSKCILSLPKKENFCIGMRIILRKDDYTLGFGTVIKV